MASVSDIDELSHDAQTSPRFAHASFKNCADVQRFSNRSQINLFAFEREGGSAGHDAKILDLGEGVNDFFGNAICKKLIFWIRTHVGEGQDYNRRLANAVT